MVGALSIHVDDTLGRDYAASETDAEENCTGCIYDSMCITWIWIWYFVCTGTSPVVWVKF